ncbi:acylneuraminate cytidylyltransferase family protein [Candidatus Pelagibacter sp.]|nr:acylneuraminate cytidylyltransferase family protein [Candidatus Pelagibacter sp.]
MKILCFIPARKNSKGIKNKNLIRLKNKPLIYYTLKTSMQIKNVYRFLSTDSKKIKKYADRFLENKIDYLRPSKIAKDNSSLYLAIKHGLDWLKKNRSLEFDAILVLQPTTPVRKISDLNKAIKLFKNKKISSLVSVVKMKEHPYECIELSKKKWSYIKKSNKKNVSGRQQYKNNFYFIDGGFYIVKTDFYLKYKTLTKENITKFYIQKKWPIDIDYTDDLKVAEAFL